MTGRVQRNSRSAFVYRSSFYLCPLAALVSPIRQSFAIMSGASRFAILAATLCETLEGEKITRENEIFMTQQSKRKASTRSQGQKDEKFIIGGGEGRGKRERRSPLSVTEDGFSAKSSLHISFYHVAIL